MTDDALRWAEDVLTFWFGTLTFEQWFKRDAAADRAISERFASLHSAVAATPPSATMITPRQALAAVIVLDQFPRNMYRDTSAAFASDAQALTLARGSVAVGHDRAFDGERSRHERLFLYLPFGHSESLDDQHRAVELISALGDPNLTRYAIAHRDIVQRFGRFPHHNVALGRVATPEEAEFLTQPNSSF